jgi:plastocyanin
MGKPVIALAVLFQLALAAAGVAAEHVVVVSEMKFGPVPAEVHVGDTIIWQNDDVFRHTATAEDGSFDIDLPAKTSASMVVTDAGSFAFYCRFHPGMTGTLAVVP